MSAYDGAGKRNSSKTHARRSHACDFCEHLPHGNGGRVAHARTHVRAGEAVELVKWYPTASSPSRIFLPVEDTERIARFQAQGYTLQPGSVVPRPSPTTRP